MGSTHRHSETEVVRRVAGLRYFSFMGEVSSGPRELFEDLRMRLRFDGRDDRGQVIGGLGLLQYGIGDPSKFTPVGSESRVPNHPDLIQPGHCTIAGSKCFIWISAGFIDVTCSADDHVSESSVGAARRIEDPNDSLLQLRVRVDRTMARHSNCVSAENFPDRFAPDP